MGIENDSLAERRSGKLKMDDFERRTASGDGIEMGCGLKAALKALCVALVGTIYSYFNGGFIFGRLDGGAVPPLWLQAMRIFLIFFVVFFLVFILFHKVKEKWEENKGG